MTNIDVKVDNAVRIIQHVEGLDRHYRKVATHVNGTYCTATANAKKPGYGARVIDWIRAEATPKDKACKADIAAGGTFRF